MFNSKFCGRHFYNYKTTIFHKLQQTTFQYIFLGNFNV